MAIAAKIQAEHVRNAGLLASCVICICMLQILQNVDIRAEKTHTGLPASVHSLGFAVLVGVLRVQHKQVPI